MMFIFNYETLIDPLLRNIRKFTPEFSGMNAGDRVLTVTLVRFILKPKHVEKP